MAQQTIKVKSPLRGINRAVGREDQPDSTVYDALNVMPFDRTGRLRVGERPGIGKLWNAAIGGGGLVQSLRQTTIALDPTTITAGTSLFAEPFTYANGNLGTVGSVNWQCRDGIYQWGAAVNVAAVQVSSNTAIPNTVNAGCARYIASSLTLGSAHVIRATVTLPAVAAGEVMLSTRIDNAAPTNSGSVNLGISTTLNPPNLRLVANNVVVTQLQIPAGVVSTGVPFTFEMRVNGDTFTGWINGIKYLTSTSTFNSSKNGVGFTFAASSSGYVVDDFAVFAGTNLASYRQTNIIAVSAGNIYVGDIATQGTLAFGGGSSALSATLIPGVAFFSNKAYFVDGVSTMKVLDLATQVVTTFVASAGAETATSLGQYQIAAIYRGRLVLAADRVNPQNFVCSKVGDPTNYDYSAGTPDGAFAGNASTAGRIGDPITALMPVADDVMYIGGDHNLWAMRGDPADGGSIDLISNSVGVLGPNAWCQSPDGTVYFIGSGGFYKLSREGELTNLSLTAYPQFFANINRGTSYAIMSWDRDRHGAFLFITPANSATATHLWYDTRTESFWPLQYPNSHGPLSALVYDGDSPTDRTLVLGGRDGIVRQTSQTLRSDDGSAAISSYLILGPLQPNPGASTLLATQFDLGEIASADAGHAERWNMDVQLYSGPDAYSVMEGTAHGTASFNVALQGRQKTARHRLRGGWFAVKMSNSGTDTYWAFESLELTFEDTGKNRMRH